MLKRIILILVVAFVVTPATAKQYHGVYGYRHHAAPMMKHRVVARYHYRGKARVVHRPVHRRVARSVQPRRHPAGSAGVGIVSVAVASGQKITVAANLASKFVNMIAEFVAAGYKPHAIGCYARDGHIPNSRHYVGAACDFDQTGRDKTVSFMYHAREIIARNGLRDGCSFGDCGHVDDGQYSKRRYVGKRFKRYRHYAKAGR